MPSHPSNRFQLLSRLPSRSPSPSLSSFNSRYNNVNYNDKKFKIQKNDKNYSDKNYKNYDDKNYNDKNYKINDIYNGLVLSDSMLSRVRTYAISKYKLINVKLSYESGCDCIKMLNWLRSPQGHHTQQYQPSTLNNYNDKNNINNDSIYYRRNHNYHQQQNNNRQVIFNNQNYTQPPIIVKSYRTVANDQPFSKDEDNILMIDEEEEIPVARPFTGKYTDILNLTINESNSDNDTDCDTSHISIGNDIVGTSIILDDEIEDTQEQIKENRNNKRSKRFDTSTNGKLTLTLASSLLSSTSLFSPATSTA
ncbi:unnamed protein product [Rotaria sordida]|uniref:Uncharacterized protein n=1 Tax=Rotaria sordida TaxID=392033 RepID=A0A814QI12_9BILA|nr:unnamed protein product [Rotaria sordida]